MKKLTRNKKLLWAILGTSFLGSISNYAEATDYTTRQIGSLVFADGDTVAVTTANSNIYSAIQGGVQVTGNGKIKVDYTFTGSQQTYGVQLNNGAGSNLGTGTIINATSTAPVGFATYGINLQGNGTSLTADQLAITVNSQGHAYGFFTGNNDSVNLGNKSHITAISTGSSAVGMYQTPGSSLIADQLTLDVTGVTSNTYGITTNAGNTQIDLGSDSTINVTGGAGSNSIIGIIFHSSGDQLTANKLTINANGLASPNSHIRGLGLVSGSVVDLGTDSKIDIKSNVAAASQTEITGIYAESNAKFTADHLAIKVSGTAYNSMGVFVYGTNSSIKLGTGSSIALNGAGTGIVMYNPVNNGTNVLTAKELTITSTESAVYVEGGGRVEITGGSRLEGTLGGVQVVGSSSSALIEDSQIILDGNGSSYGGLRSDGVGALIEAKNVTITSDSFGLGIVGIEGGTVQSENTTIDIFEGGGVYAYDSGTLINLTGETTIHVSSGETSIYAQDNAKVTGVGKMDLRGNINTDTNGFVDLQMTSGSQLTGAVDPNSPGGIVNLAMTDSQWGMSDVSYVNNLALARSTVDIGFGVDYQTLFVDNLDGDGTFKMRTDVAAGGAGATIGSGAIGMGGGDLLSVTGTTHGSYLLDIQNQASAASNSTYEHLVVETADGEGQFDLTHKVEVGAYQYDLHRDSVNSNNWSLFRTPDLTPAAATAANEPRARYYLNYAENQTLIQRMGDLRNNSESAGNVWAKVVFGKNKVNKTTQLSGFDQTYGGIQVGSDKKTDWKDGQFYKGLFLGYMDGNQDYQDGKGNIGSTSIGAYGTYIGNNGFYVDGVLKFNWQRQSFHVFDTAGELVKSKSNTTGAMASLEIGKRIHLDNKSKQGFYLEPQAQISWGSQSGDNYTTSSGLNVDMDGYHSLLGRVGLLAGYELKGGRNPINVYAKASYNHEFEGNYGLNMNGAIIKGDLGDSWWTYGVGLAAKIGTKHNIYTDIERASGGDFTQSWKVNLGYRFQW